VEWRGEQVVRSFPMSRVEISVLERASVVMQRWTSCLMRRRRDGSEEMW